jgi:hypothetical protein
MLLGGSRQHPLAMSTGTGDPVDLIVAKHQAGPSDVVAAFFQGQYSRLALGPRAACCSSSNRRGGGPSDTGQLAIISGRLASA